MKIPNTTKRHQIGTCPACRYGLWADVDISVEVHEPQLTSEGKATVHVSPRLVGMRVFHSCGLDERNGEWLHADPADAPTTAGEGEEDTPC